jgi:lipopolysaccharide transport system permease protein
MIRAIGRTSRCLWINRRFTLMMARYEMQAKNKGAMLGFAWLLIRPLVQLAAYIAVLNVFAGGRLNEPTGSLTIYVLSGLIIWQGVQRTLEEAPSMVRDRMEILKQVSYPLETLPVNSIISSFVGPAVGLLALVIMLMATNRLSPSLVLLPLPLVLAFLFSLGVSWVLMVIGAVLKDLREIVAVILGLAVYFSPVILSEELVGVNLWQLVLLNPLSHIVICFRDILFGTFHATSWFIFTAMSLGAFALGAWVVDRAKMVINEYL